MIEKNEKQLIAESGLAPSLISAELSRRLDNPPELFASYEIDSTNRRARSYHEDGAGRPAVFIADGQMAGRGRRGRSFSSPHGSGVYMSLLIYPEGELRDFTAVTTYTAVAVCRAIERVAGLHADVKWVNDIFYKGKKIGGILTEGALSSDMRTAEHVIVGIGLNVLKSELPPEVARIATSIEEMTGRRVDRNLLIAEIVAEFFSGLEKISSEEILEEYKRRSFLVGREVTVLKLNSSYPARVIGIGKDMSLTLRLVDGSIENLITGEVSIREK